MKLSDGTEEYVYIWEFEVDPEHAGAFERAYGPNGDWARLFARADGYRGTTLLKRCDDPGRYVTIDRWRSFEDNQAFHRRFGEAFARLDAACEQLTRRERKLGDFDAV